MIKVLGSRKGVYVVESFSDVQTISVQVSSNAPRREGWINDAWKSKSIEIERLAPESEWVLLGDKLIEETTLIISSRVYARIGRFSWLDLPQIESGGKVTYAAPRSLNTLAYGAWMLAKAHQPDRPGWYLIYLTAPLNDGRQWIEAYYSAAGEWLVDDGGSVVALRDVVSHFAEVRGPGIGGYPGAGGTIGN